MVFFFFYPDDPRVCHRWFKAFCGSRAKGRDIIPSVFSLSLCAHDRTLISSSAATNWSVHAWGVFSRVCVFLKQKRCSAIAGDHFLKECVERPASSGNDWAMSCYGDLSDSSVHSQHAKLVTSSLVICHRCRPPSPLAPFAAP